jgi:DNA-binding response OmpR family regulator
MARVLIIDDDPTVPGLLKTLFAEKRGDEVTLIGEPAQAVLTAESLRPDVILLASNISGIDVLTLVSQLQANGSMPIVLYGQVAAADEARLTALAIICLQSPINTDELLAARDQCVVAAGA